MGEKETEHWQGRSVRRPGRNLKYIFTMGYSNRDLESLTAVLVAVETPTMTRSLRDRIREFVNRTPVFGSKN
jgi:hypothetical protein